MLTHKKARTKRRDAGKRTGKKVTKELFWVLPGHPDLDRAGDLLLQNLTEIRSESISRAPAG